jgi:hypothetical protein
VRSGFFLGGGDDRISSLQAYDNTGHPYDVLRVLTADHSSLNMTAYQDYSPLYLP